MIEVTQNLFIGPLSERDEAFSKKMAVVSALPEANNFTDKNFILTATQIKLNYIDAIIPEQIDDAMIDASLLFIKEQLSAGKQVYVHCMFGVSRSPSLVFMYLLQEKLLAGTTIEEKLISFQKLYPPYQPS